MYPPPPRFPAPGCVTASAKPVATAASTAFPPFFKMSRPTFEATGSTDTTAPFGNDVGPDCGEARHHETAASTTTQKAILFMGALYSCLHNPLFFLHFCTA